MIGIHIKPSDAVSELNKLEVVYDDFVEETGIKVWQIVSKRVVT